MTISGKIRCVKFCGAVSRVSTTARASENSNPIAKNTRFHASARARPGLFRLSKILCRGQHFLAQQRAHQRIQSQSLHTLDFMQVRVRGLGSHARHATPRGGAAPPRRGAGDGDGLLAEQTTQKPASAPPRTCRTAPTVLLSVEDMLRTSLSAGRRRATLVRQAAPSPRAKA